MVQISQAIAHAALACGAIRLRPRDPFTWTSGYRMPIYNDNRWLLSTYANRKLVGDGFVALVQDYKLHFDVVAGTATAGICPATTLADRLQTRFAYVRKEAKGHGTQSRIEGQLARNETVLLVEDLISTGGSSIAAVSGLREAGALVEHCLAIFSYGFPEAEAAFAAAGCQLHVLLRLADLLGVAEAEGHITGAERGLLAEWQTAPFAWGEAHGFTRVSK